MSDRFPEYIDPLYLAERGREFGGEMPLNALERLKDVIKNPNGTVKLRVSFEKDGRLSVVKGHIETMLLLECQNCLQFLEWSINSSFELAAVTSLDQVNLLPDRYEPLLLEEKIKLTDIIEDEILLSIPAIPKHQSICFDTSQNAQLNEKTKKDSPFSILKQLKNTGV